MSERNDYLEQHPELEGLSPQELEKHLEEAGERAEAQYETMRDEEPTPAEHWIKIKELAKAIELGAQDLQDLLDKPVFTFDANGKMVL